MENEGKKSTGGFHVHVYSPGNHIAETMNLTYNGPVYFGKDYQEKPQVSDEQFAKALMAINGKGRAIDSQRAWLGACLLLGYKYGFPLNLNDCCKQIDLLPLNQSELEFPCKYESIRMYGCWKFVSEPYDNWPTYQPKEDEKSLFQKCYAVAQALDKEIKKQMGNMM